ncbi:MAG: hypothetical protein ACI9ON_004127 [Limisphaerales bacterium]|jgi:hypothetical protein
MCPDEGGKFNVILCTGSGVFVVMHAYTSAPR